MNSPTQTTQLDSYYACDGKHITLYRFQPYFTDFIFQCYKNEDFISRYRLYQRQPKNKQELHKELLTIQSLPPEMLKSIEWVIVDKATQQPIGLAGLVNYQQLHAYAELLVGLLKSKETQHKPYGPEATLLVLEYAFQTVRLNKLISFIYAYNDKVQQSTLRLGFQQEGLLKQHILAPSGKHIDLFQNALLSEEFFASEQLTRLSQRIIGRDITQQRHAVVNILANRQ
ncbi:MAG: GNAT family N-acetyltransferase [Methyloprofundus sp.]|nr:GNAT family N-acetyltransferase [Methyloprofundus sp.]